MVTTVREFMSLKKLTLSTSRVRLEEMVAQGKAFKRPAEVPQKKEPGWNFISRPDRKRVVQYHLYEEPNF